MIKVKVNYALFYDLPKEEIELAAGSIEELKELLASRLKNPFSIAVNGQIATDNQLLKDGDEVFVFPYLSGG
ncbi:MoaD/ThiS family protein [Carboxydothermus hydrogenoformans]|uniref:Thiamine biosynthesis protein ThiS n=1 Tax=Carboxydothermus hydrogenoformans (strain ATCC BAA-161 / DSM 6008 / Z-2901) TaxID=246194 RepID=Q3ABB8_CARHZ|nr:MoaD/ThiS family protein [Carboxydothermus hydrogenoformans]ABB14229.1 thiamine biosynthesis protein ThiS [Carboxydothermus hydrogenoformans Z-2901]